MSTIVFTVFYFIFSFCLIYPPPEFVSAGITIVNLFSNYLGSENEQFIQHHIRRVVITVLAHSLLPFIYVLGYWISDSDLTFNELYFEGNLLWQMFVNFTVILPVVVSYKMLDWANNNWNEHFICRNLIPFCNPSENWLSVAASINIEFRRVEKLCIKTNAVTTVIATESWILKIAPYTIYVAHQSDTSLILNKSDTHAFSPSTGGDVQFINIDVKSSRRGSTPFSLRLNALDFKELQDHVNRPIRILPNIQFHKTLLERFIEAFKQQIILNEKYQTDQELDQCMGCMIATPNVKLRKICNQDVNVDGDESCIPCHCKPMWCVDCMAKWFASRQDQQTPELWLNQKCSCPLCRATFCILDVSLVEPK